MTSKSCPSRDEIIRFLEDRGPEESNKRLLDHVLQCPGCRVILEATLEIRSRSRGVLKGLEGLDLGSREARAGLRARARRELRALRADRKAGARRLRWLAIPAAGSVLALLVAFVVLPALRTGRAPIAERNAGGLKIGLIAPRAQSPSAALDFRWNGIPAVRTYRLEIYDQTLERVYRSPALGEPHYSLPEDVSAALRKVPVFFWKITATMEDGKVVESEFGRFPVQR